MTLSNTRSGNPLPYRLKKTLDPWDHFRLNSSYSLIFHHKNEFGPLKPVFPELSFTWFEVIP